MHTCALLQSLCTFGHYVPQCHSIYGAETHMLQLTMTTLLTVPLRVLHIMATEVA